jgi:hypothetical protein
MRCTKKTYQNIGHELTKSKKEYCFSFRGLGWGKAQLARRPLVGLLYQPRTIDDYGAVGRMKIGRGNFLGGGGETCPIANFSTTKPTCP